MPRKYDHDNKSGVLPFAPTLNAARFYCSRADPEFAAYPAVRPVVDKSKSERIVIQLGQSSCSSNQ
jgi:hypothetical protein